MKRLLIVGIVVVAALSIRAWIARQAVARAASGTEDVVTIDGANAAAAATVRRRWVQGRTSITMRVDCVDGPAGASLGACSTLGDAFRVSLLDTGDSAPWAVILRGRADSATVPMSYTDYAAIVGSAVAVVR